MPRPLPRGRQIPKHGRARCPPCVPQLPSGLRDIPTPTPKFRLKCQPGDGTLVLRMKPDTWTKPQFRQQKSEAGQATWVSAQEVTKKPPPTN